MSRKAGLFLALSSVVALLLVCSLPAYAQSSTASQSVGKITKGKAKMVGTAKISGAPSANFSSTPTPRTKRFFDLVAARRSSMSTDAASAARAVAKTLSVPTPTPNAVKNGGNTVGFAGLTTVDTANTNGFVLSPPDQGLCVGNGSVLEVINLVMAVYSETGTQLTAPVSVNSFFGADPAVTFLSDPRCYYDIPTQRWFVSITNVLNFSTGRSNLYLAVSQTSDPTGAFTVYSIDTTDDGLDGTPSDPGCTTASPCFGDQPLLGADAFGIYLSTNEFGVFSNTFNGTQIYALSKADLVAGTPFTLVHIGDLPLAEGIAFSVHPASSPDLSGEAAPGVEYFLSSLNFTGTLDNRIAVWAMTNTSSLTQASPSVSLMNVVITSEVYGEPPLATQEAGPFPLGMSLGDPEETLNTDDDRMQQVTFAGEHLWGAVTTVVSDGTNINAGIAYFDVKPKMKGDNLTASVQGQGYVSVQDASVIYPALGVTADGTAAVAFTLTGPSYFPSAAFSHVTPGHSGSVNIVAAGAAPADDFSGYPQFGGSNGFARWGDYSWAVADGNSLWLATEYIPGTINSLDFLTNFGTFIYEVNLD
jgi:hypothetical protein